MRVSITYLYTIFRYGYPPRIEDDFHALADIEKMGFHYLEMEGLGGQHTQQVMARKQDLRKALDDHGIHVHNFCAVDPDLVSLDESRRQAAYERFRQTAELGVYLGTETLHLASYAPPVEYPRGAPYQLDSPYSFGDTFKVRIPEGFRWPLVWAALVESCRFCADVAARYERMVIMEPRVGETICSVDSLLRLIEDVDRPNFVANFDCGHFSAQRENVPLALMKLEGRYANIHISDNDPRDTRHLAVGDGSIDWDEFFRILKLQGYNGYLGLDLGGTANLTDDLQRSLEQIQKSTQKHGLTLEW
jgi:sugar phosphate isomerase/epimerase